MTGNNSGALLLTIFGLIQNAATRFLLRRRRLRRPPPFSFAAAPAISPAADLILYGGFMRKAVFLSSTGKDLSAYRAQVIEDLRGHDWFRLDAIKEWGGARGRPCICAAKGLLGGYLSRPLFQAAPPYDKRY